MTYTMTMRSNAAMTIATANFDNLSRADYQFSTPFAVSLEDGDFIADAVLRLVPGRRMVARGKFNGKEVIAKIYFDKKHAARHAKAELRGVKAMSENKIPSPTLHYDGRAVDKRLQVLLFDRIEANSLETLWLHRESDDSVLPVLRAVVIEIATQHVLGVLQKDMHMGNFLITGKTIYTIDGGAIELKPKMLSKEDSMENLALFLSQLGAGVEALQEHLFLYYARARGWIIKPKDRVEMMLLVKKFNHTRWQSYAKKIFRHSTDFKLMRRLFMRGMMKREMHGPEWQAFLQKPDSVFTNKDVQMLKDGRSSTVIKVAIDGRELVIKRYNLKNIWHRLRRMPRATRAQTSWRLAQKMKLFHIETAEPLAYLESSFLGLRGKSYYITEPVQGTDIRTYLADFKDQPYSAITVLTGVADLIKSLLQVDMTHGDLKATNIIINEKQKPVLIDLDGAAEHLSLMGLQKAWQGEVERFLQNFDDMPMIRDLLQRLLQIH